MNEQEGLEAARAKLKNERDALRDTTAQYEAATARLVQLERNRVAAAQDPEAHAEARKAETACREECERLATLMHVHPRAITAAEKAVRSAEWLVASANLSATLERLRLAYEYALDATVAHWASIGTLAALITEANRHAEAMAKLGTPAPCGTMDLVRTAGLVSDLVLPTEHKLSGHGHRDRDTIVGTIAARMRRRLKLPENETACGYPSARQVLDMVTGRYLQTLADFASRARPRRATGGAP